MIGQVAHWTEWDTRSFARGAAIATLTLVLVGVVTAASDEGGLAWGVRAGRTLPLAPVCAAVGAWLALAPARARGDERALATLGRSPWEREVAAILGGAIVALAAALAIGCFARIDVTGFYPRAEQSVRWTHDATGFKASDGQWRVDPDGVDPPIPPSGPPCNAEIPRRIHVEVPGEEADVQFRYDDVRWNPPIPEGSFTQPPSDSMPTVPVTCD